MNKLLAAEMKAETEWLMGMAILIFSADISEILASIFRSTAELYNCKLNQPSDV